MLKKDELDLLHLLKKHVLKKIICICVAELLKNTVQAKNTKQQLLVPILQLLGECMCLHSIVSVLAKPTLSDIS